MPRRDAASKRRMLNRYLLALAILVLLVLIAYLLGHLGGRRGTISGTRLSCSSNDQVMPFGDRILYYKNATLYCLSSSGEDLWKASVGDEAKFSVGEKYVAVWNGSQLMLFTRNGTPTYSDRLNEPVQFARVGSKYVAVVTGEGVRPTLTLREMNGTQIDKETNNYIDLMILDCGFFGDGEYLWTTALDVYGAAPETVMHIYRVGSMNTGNISLGSYLNYAVVYSGSYLNVLSTRKLRLFDYRGTENTADSVLVYGWKLVSSTATSSYPYLLMTSVLSNSDDGTFDQIRLLHGKTDIRYTLPNSCLGAAIRNKQLYAFSANSMYRADIGAQHFSALRLPVDGEVTAYLGMTTNGTVLLACGSAVWAVKLP